jgi:predicted HAD superfamily Cof-like phosphohydrolase
MKEQLTKLKEFHDAFGHPVANTPTTSVNHKLRYELMAEENLEYYDAVEAGDLVETADALADQLYILCGTIVAHGMQHIIEKVFAEVHDSNMSKLGADGKPIYREDGKIMKGPDYKKPDIGQFL